MALIDPEYPSDPGTGLVVVVGSANADLVTAVDRRPGAGETVPGSDPEVLPGGKGANQALAAGLLGANVAFVGCIGRDTNGDLLASSLQRAGVDLSHLRRVDTPTGLAIIAVTPDGDNSIIVTPGANACVSDVDIDTIAPLVAAAAVMVLQMELPAPVVARAARIAGTVGTRVVLNLSPSAPLDDDVLGLCDPLVVNEHEAMFLLGPDAAGQDPRALAAMLRRRGARSVVITIGAAGAVVAGEGGIVHVPAPQVSAVDTTGAGDAFTGALAWRLACGETLADAAGYAVRVGSYAVRGKGAQTSFPTRDSVLP